MFLELKYAQTSTNNSTKLNAGMLNVNKKQKNVTNNY